MVMDKDANLNYVMLHNRIWLWVTISIFKTDINTSWELIWIMFQYLLSRSHLQNQSSRMPKDTVLLNLIWLSLPFSLFQMLALNKTENWLRQSFYGQGHSLWAKVKDCMDDMIHMWQWVTMCIFKWLALIQSDNWYG